MRNEDSGENSGPGSAFTKLVMEAAGFVIETGKPSLRRIGLAAGRVWRA
jgi:hypothetical protein